MAMRLVPATSHSNTHSHLQAQTHGAPSAPGVYDVLRSGVGPSIKTNTSSSSSSLQQLPDSAHPLESRLKQWEATQEALKMEGLRRTFGMAEPIRRGMELKIARDGEWRPAVLGVRGPGVHEDILSGRDTGITWEDVFVGDEMRGLPGFHEEVERKVRMGQ